MNKSIFSFSTTFCTMLALCFIISAKAYSQEGPPKPPKEAIEACDKKADGDSCSFTGPHNDTLNGTCRKGPGEGNKLACTPKPPKEAIDACNSKTDGSSCSFVTPNGDTINGSCRKGPPGVDELACGPSGDRPHPEEDNKPNSAN